MSWRELPTKSKALIVFIAALAAPIIIWSVFDIIQRPPESGWLVLTLLSVLTVPFFLLLPSVSTIINIGDAYIMSVSMIYGISPCIVATLCHTLSASLFVPNRPKVYVHRIV